MSHPTPAAVLRGLIAAAAVFGSAGPAAAQFGKSKVKVAAKVGLPPGLYAQEREDNQGAFVAKANTWAPIHLEVEILGEIRLRDERVVLRVETTDPDDLANSSTVELGTIADKPPGTRLDGKDFPYTPYVRVAYGADITLTVTTTEGNALGEPFRIRYFTPADPGRYVVLSLGSKLPGFDLPKGSNEPQPAQRSFRGGHVVPAAITDVAQMPDQWFGYDNADLVVLTTGQTSDAFLKALFTDPSRTSAAGVRREALLEWVRRGGKLLVSVGGNLSLVNQFPAFREFLPVRVSPEAAAVAVRSVDLDWRLGNAPQKGSLAARTGATFDVARLLAKPDQSFRPVLSAADTELTDRPARGLPVAVQSHTGLGRVTVTAFDLDRSPFVDFDKKAEFWDWLLREAGAKASAPEVSGRPGGTTPTPNTGESDLLAAALRGHIDNFEGVPVISFGWVAVFIILYTLLIGPVEYLILKKVFKRLELTWVTFPIIVVTVSAIAYFTAYALKGKDLKANKIDVVDVDLRGGRVYGQAWFSVFSPRIENYSIGVEPAAGWALAGGRPPAPLVSWMAGGGRGGGRQSFFRRSYTYHTDTAGDDYRFADGLVGVPIQVWSSKAFAANWSAALDPQNPPVTSTLTHPPGDPTDVTGTVTINLPLPPLRDAYFVYAGNAYPATVDGRIVSRGDVVTFLRGAHVKDWLTRLGDAARLVAPNVSDGFNRGGIVVNQGNAGGSAARLPSVYAALFHEQMPGGGVQNASLRRLDQSWRLSEANRDEVVLVARVEPVMAEAEELAAGSASPSPSRVWLKGLPEPGKDRPPLPGKMRQETYVRVFIPVKPAGGR